jgi:hypothetical protein
MTPNNRPTPDYDAMWERMHKRTARERIFWEYFNRILLGLGYLAFGLLVIWCLHAIFDPQLAQLETRP